jgi:uncharacterized repeat protein (TIGR03843 family)
MMSEINDIITILKKGHISLSGEFVWGSNYTFLVLVKHDNKTIHAVYKPSRGERPLWDFPIASLAMREVAAYYISEALGWNFVPPTVYRKSGPLSAGSLQLYIDHDPRYHYFSFKEEDRQRLRRVAIFDILVNNADRKGSHILIDDQQHIWLIDHGVCFHAEDKLRTVIWDFIGEPIPDDIYENLQKFRRELRNSFSQSSGISNNLSKYISQDEIVALLMRTEKLLKEKQFPLSDPNRRPFPLPEI